MDLIKGINQYAGLIFIRWTPALDDPQHPQHPQHKYYLELRESLRTGVENSRIERLRKEWKDRKPEDVRNEWEEIHCNGKKFDGKLYNPNEGVDKDPRAYLHNINYNNI